MAVRLTKTWETTAKMLSNLIGPLDSSTGTSNERLANALRAGGYEEWTQFFTDLEPLLTRETATGIRLAGMLEGFGVPVGGETDDDLIRAKLAARVSVMWNDSTASGVIATAVAITGLDATSFTYTENVEGGSYSPNYAELSFDADALIDVGIDSADISAVVDEVTDAVNEVAPSGFRINTILTGGAEWDDVAAIWDDPDTIWSG